MIEPAEEKQRKTIPEALGSDSNVGHYWLLTSLSLLEPTSSAEKQGQAKSFNHFQLMDCKGRMYCFRRPNVKYQCHLKRIRKRGTPLYPSWNSDDEDPGKEGQRDRMHLRVLICARCLRGSTC
ncbi:hypothetical protein EMCG_04010 [[Emmonsia] crescens]|uniref:Uncharacterized protein n=1 Tax=[Emmonsia] crescens TaxID=73230 RepID=A0A0G2HUF5_9EURO|nr:hypothetical protein EMCG_04010 [Emmonsia crescens UAMH 3008]